MSNKKMVATQAISPHYFYLFYLIFGVSVNGD
jgi:hypothetical protein